MEYIKVKKELNTYLDENRNLSERASNGNIIYKK